MFRPLIFIYTAAESFAGSGGVIVQYQLIHNLLSAFDGKMWLDSGTLLGFMREGRILPHDKDIDLGIWADDLDIDELARIVHGLNGTFKTKLYGGIVYHVSIALDEPGMLPIHVNVYRKYKGHAWCAQGHQVTRNQIIRRLLALYFRYISGDRSPISRAWPSRNWYTTYTWWIPEHYFASTNQVRVGDFTFDVPTDWDAYLAARYGDWRTPIKHWRYWRDDKCIRLLPPEALMG